MRYALLTVAALLVCSASAVEDPTAAAKAMRDRQDAETLTAALAWMNAVDLSPIAKPALGKDPRASEVAEAAKVDALNGELKQWVFWKEQAAKGNEDAKDALRNWWRSLATPHGADLAKQILAHKGAADAKPVAKRP